jgi:hypothetical protein
LGFDRWKWEWDPPKELHLLSGLVFMVNEVIFSIEAKSVSPCRKEFRNRK